MEMGKNDDKMMGLMFPRLRVNDTEKGGPKAPPRNKMALYEQFTIPSQRYNSNVVPPNQNNSNGLTPSTSTSQGTCRERNTYLHLYQPSSCTASEEIRVRNAEALSLNNQLVCVETKKTPLEDDIMVPLFSLAATEICNINKSQNSIASEGIIPTAVDEERYQSNNGHQESHKLTSLKNIAACLWNDHGDSLLVANDAINNEVVRIDDDQYLEKESINKGDGVSETSMVDSASMFDITPDDVVDIIGRKQFWNARSAIIKVKELSQDPMHFKDKEWKSCVGKSRHKKC